MTKEDIMLWWYSPNVNINPYIYAKYTKDGQTEIEELHKSELSITRTKDGFAYILSYPGPVCVVYNFQDYGTTWAFTEEEIKNGVSGQ